MTTCQQCHRDVKEILSLKGRPTRLDKNGICGACREVNAEVAAEAADKLAEARRLVAAADQRNIRRIQIDTTAFERAHGKRPRGVGSWAFCPAENYKSDRYLDHCRWFNGPYGWAKTQAIIAFAKADFSGELIVCS